MENNLRLLLRDTIHKYLQFLSQTIHRVNINTHVDLSLKEFAVDIAQLIIDGDPNWKKNENNYTALTWKYTKYNQCIIIGKRKYKIFVGINAKISGYNFHKMHETFSHTRSMQSSLDLRSNGFRVECYDIIPGITVRDIIEGDFFGVYKSEDVKHLENADLLWELFFDFVRDNYKVDDKGFVFYPNDNQCSNFIIDPDAKTPTVEIIDFDHGIYQPPEQVCRSITDRWFNFIFDYNPKELKRVSRFWLWYVLNNNPEQVRKNFHERLLAIYGK
jgi:hypothetical protein